MQSDGEYKIIVGVIVKPPPLRERWEINIQFMSMNPILHGDFKPVPVFNPFLVDFQYHVV